MAAAGFEDDDVSSSDEDEQMLSADEISDDSEDLLAAAQGQQSSDEPVSDDEHDIDEGAMASTEDGDGDEPAEEVGHAAAAGQHTQAAGPEREPTSNHDMLLMAQTTSDGTAVQLQVVELLKEVRASLSAARAAQLEEDLQRLRKVLQAISPHQVPGSQAAGFIRDLGLSPAAVSLQFQPPSVVATVGSMPLGAALLQSGATPGTLQPVTVDVAVVMPSACFFRKAHLNYRYHAMRALYLAAICNHLAACPAFAARTMQLETLQQDPSRPVLLLSAPVPHIDAAGSTQAAAGDPTYQLRIIPCCSPALFPLPRLAPDRNGVRWVRKRSSPDTTTNTSNAAAALAAAALAAASKNAGVAVKGAATQQQGTQAGRTHSTHMRGTADPSTTAALAATPTYNQGILSDMLVLAHAAVLHKAARAVPAFANGLVLLKVWALQHGLGCSGPAGSADGLDGHTLAMLLAHLVEQGKLTSAMSPLQVLRCALQALSGATPSATAAGSLAKGILAAHVAPDTLHDAATAAAPALLSPKFASQHAGHAATKARASQQPVESMQALVAVTLGLDGPAGTALAQAGQHGPATTLSASPFVKLAAATAATVSHFRKAQPAVLLDPLGVLNCACRVSKPALAAACSAAKSSLALLNTPADAESAFASVLLSPCRHATNYDYMWAIDVPPHPSYHSTVCSTGAAGAPQAGVAQAAAAAKAAKHAEAAVKAKGKPKPKQGTAHAAEDGDDQEEAASQHWDRACVGAVCAWREQEAALESTIKAALTDRAILVRVLQRCVPPAPVTALQHGLLPVSGPHEVLVGARLDPSLATRLVDVGPAADDTKASAKFRAFWGDMAELRRFQDGKISEAVVWGGPATGLAGRHTIPDAIVQYAVRRHRPGGALGTLRSSAGALDPVLRRQDDDNPDSAVLSERLLDAATDKLSKQLRALEGLALKVVAVQPLSAACRHTEVFPPAPHPLAGGVPAAELGDALGPGSRVPRVLQPQHMLVQLENSGRWPSNPVAFAKMKAALGVQLAQTLDASLGLTTQVSEESVDVLFEGFAFRLQLYSGRDEAMLLERSRAAHLNNNPSQPQGGAPLVPNQQVSVQQASPESTPLIRSWHHGLISRVAGANPSFAPACRLAKRWVAAHGLSNHVPLEAVELLVAAVYTTQGGPRGTPGSRTAGLLRFLQLLCQHPWAARPLVVDPDASLDAAAHRALQHKFSERRGQAGGSLPALYIVTPHDLTSSHWTRQHPEPAVLFHMVSLAKSCMAAACQLLDGSASPLQPSITGGAQLNGHHNHDDDNGEAGGSDAMELDEDKAASRQQSHEAALLGALFAPQLQQYDMLLQLRGEALPLADCTLPGFLAGGGSGKRSCRQPDALWQLVEGQAERDVPPPKRARAFLDAFPDKALQGRGPAALRQELLVGFNPLTHLTASLQQHLLGGTPSVQQHATLSSTQQAAPAGGDTATPASESMSAAVLQHHHSLPLLGTLRVDELGGRLVGVKWAPAAFLPAAPKITSCHTSLPCVLTGLTPRAQPGAPGGATATGPGCVPDVARIVSDVCDLGQGMVQAVHLPRGCHHLPVGSST